MPRCLRDRKERVGENVERNYLHEETVANISTITQKMKEIRKKYEHVDKAWDIKDISDMQRFAEILYYLSNYLNVLQETKIENYE